MSAVADVLAELSGAAQRLGWQKFGACRSADDSTYYPDRGSRAQVSNAKRTCASCPVTGPCLEWAMTNNEQHGVWGGLTRRERAELRRSRAAAARAATAAATPTTAVHASAGAA